MILDLFAGPGGWDVAARELGVHTLGIEWDDAACKTRAAAGLPTRKADIAELAPGEFGPVVDGLIASPPCQAWSMAGKRDGEKDKPLVYRCLADLADGKDTRAEHRARCEDERSLLVVEPLRWALALEPTWIALEQVPPVLELWEEYARILAVKGWRVWTGILSAERYGVPQTRKRAILMAHRDRYPAPPQATHQAYVPGEPARHEITLEGELLPWVSMATALGWGMTERPYPVIASGRSTGGPDKEKVGGSAARQAIYDEQAAGRWALDPRASMGEGMIERHGPRDPVPATEPAPHVTTKMRSAEWVQDRPATNVNADPRVFPPEYYERGIVKRASGAVAKGEPLRDENQEDFGCGDPLGLKGDDWPDRRPATTVAGDPRVFQPGGHHGEGEQSQNAVRVTEQEAAILQGFPPDYPFQGSRTKRFEQIGNAIPPPLAKAVLSEFAESAHLNASTESAA